MYVNGMNTSQLNDKQKSGEWCLYHSRRTQFSRNMSDHFPSGVTIGSNTWKKPALSKSIWETTVARSNCNSYHLLWYIILNNQQQIYKNRYTPSKTGSQHFNYVMKVLSLETSTRNRWLYLQYRKPTQCYVLYYSTKKKFICMHINKPLATSTN